MTKSFDDAQSTLLAKIADSDMTIDGAATIAETLKTLAEAQKLLAPDSTTETEPTGLKGFLRRNSGDLIKAGSTLGAIVTIGIIETKFDVIFRSKATKFI